MDVMGAVMPTHKVYVVMHHEYDYDYSSDTVEGVFGSRAEAEEAKHWKMLALNNNGSVSFRVGDKRPKVKTFLGCCDIEEHEVSFDE
jgi:hypothetical protein